MRPLGDYAEDATVDFKFNTHQTDGTPITLAGSPAISVYKSNGTTESTAGVTLTIDFDSRTGVHHVLVDTSADAFYATGNDYQVMITAGTVDGTSVVGTVVAEFSIENRYGFRPATDKVFLGNGAHGGAAASVQLQTVLVQNPNGDAVTFQSTGFNGAGLNLIAHGTGGDLEFNSVDAGLAKADKMLGYFQLVCRADIGLETDRSTELAEINNNEGSGAGDYSSNAESQEANLTYLGGTINPAIAAISVPTAAQNRAEMDANSTQLASLATQIGTAGNGLTAIPWNSAWDAEVESEVNDALDTAIPELGVGQPAATPTIRAAIMLMYMALRNQLIVQTSGADALEIHNNAGTKIAGKTITDDGSDYTEAKMA